MRAIFVYNILSGRGIKEKKLNNIKQALLEVYPDITFCPTSKLGDAKKITEKYLARVDLIIVLGGDGTINDVVSAIASSKYFPAIGIIPNGTMNDLAHSLNIPKDYRRAIEVIKKNNVIQKDILKVNDHYAIYGVAMGRFASTSYDTKQRLKKKIGRLAYFVTAAKDMFRYPPMELKIDINGRKISGKYALILIANGDYVAGFKLNKNSSNSLTRMIMIEERNNNKYCSYQSMIDIIKLFLFGIKDNYTIDNNVILFDNFCIHNTKNTPIVLDGEQYISDKYYIQILHKRIPFISNIIEKKL